MERPALVGDWLGRRAQLAPTAPAIVDLSRPGQPEPRTISYQTLERETNQVARWLQARGVGQGDRVAVLAKNRIEVIQLWFACGKLGAILQALNWRLTAAELAPLLDHAEPRLLCWDSEFAGLVARLRGLSVAAQPEFVALDDTDDLCLSSCRELPDAPLPALALAPSEPWVLCYTGGTTGLPKAAILTHATVTWNAINTTSSWGLSERDVAILNAPLFHTGGLNVFTAPLIHAGGCSILCREFELEQLFDIIESREVSCFFGVPAMFQAMQAHPRWASAPLDRVRTIISGGAPCPKPVFEQFWARGVDFKTGYGLTEAGPNNFWLPRERVRDKPGAVGWPLLHVAIRIVNASGGECGPDEVGELWIRGPHVSPGYFRDPEATAASFVDGWLHTGDLARAQADGCVTIVGRSKDMIISGGENIYPAEVESAIAAHEAVVEVAVIGVPDPRWGEVGRAFVVLADGASLELAELQSFLRERLAKYKLPRSLVILSALPRTGAGKLDKRALERG
ncbi:O-succinylbenzoic acid--CoA ligase [Enhygromyxa salina]|uniref:O-succinylbenzoic acid--CoA ligase n=1 Tax=Enhygromyxa salina TaxID=215803 RepID=A0A0C1ZM35_9BACT|nr:long-chain fatty acid--CoA ligase [Enhygromyxa salina]KIG11953.1 O-succinylbenzoic acid--CoA ligase [Enhygromyxa salina]